VLRQAAFAGVRRFVYAASSSCYGDGGEAPLSEAAALRPQSPYALAKLMGEADCIDATKRGLIETVRLRFFNVYGPRQDPRGSYAGVISAFADAVQHGRPLTIYGDGEQTRDFVHVSDVAHALVTAGWQSGVDGQVFNIGTGRRTSLLSLAAAVGEVSGDDVITVHAPSRAGDVLHSCADVTAAKEVLGSSSRVGLRDGLAGLLHVGHKQAA
jgi:UDP-glucose 4-epimerase